MKVFLGIFLVCLLVGCKTPAPPPAPPPPQEPARPAPPPPAPQIIEKTISLQPVTATLVNELDKYEAVPYFQYYISNPVVLFSDSMGGMRGSNNRGTLELTSDFARDIIIIDAKIKGEVVDIRKNAAGKMILEVCFEPDNPDARLRFTESGAEGYFDLETDNGTTRYGGMRYQVQAGADRLTRLLINIESTIDPNISTRYLPGRDIGNDKMSAPGEFQFNQPSFQPSSQSSFQPDISQEWGIQEWGVIDFEVVAEARGRPVFKVQVGAFVERDHAQAAFDRLSGAGFSPVYERRNNFYRVVVDGVSADDLSEVTRQLDFAGFSDPWIRKEN